MITKEVMEEYEVIRKCGYTNMFDINGVRNWASLMGLELLGSLTEKEYRNLLMNYSQLMDKHGLSKCPYCGALTKVKST